MAWEDATHVWADQNGPDDGFYVQVRPFFKFSPSFSLYTPLPIHSPTKPNHFLFHLKVRNNKKIAILIKEVNPRKRLFMVYRPNIGKQVKLETYADLKKRSKKVLLLFIRCSSQCFWFSISQIINLTAMNIFFLIGCMQPMYFALAQSIFSSSDCTQGV